MSTIYPVSLERHAHRAWNKTAGYGWARGEQVVPVSLQEAPQLMMSLPLGFVQHEGQFQFVALLGLYPGMNLLVGSDERWLAPVVPMRLQNHPFRRLRDTDGHDLLGVDEAGLLPPDAAGGTRLFDDNGKPAAELLTILGQLVKGETERQQTTRVVAILSQHGLLEPWELRAQDDDGGQLMVEGLFRVNESALNDISAEALPELHKSRALPMAYCQLLSMQHIHLLAKLARAQAATRQRTGAIDNHGTISFANL